MLEQLLKESFFAELEEVLENKKFIDPNAPPRPQDVVVDQMSELEKAIYTLSSKKAKLAGMSMLRIMYENVSKDDEEKLIKAMKILDAQAKTLNEIMWILIKDRLQLWDKSIGVRSNYLVVWFDDNKDSSARDLKDLISILGRAE